MAIILQLNVDDPTVYSVGHGAMDPEYREFVYSSFSAWLARNLEQE